MLNQFTLLVNWSIHPVMLSHRHRPLCSTPVFGGNRHNFAPWCHGNGNLRFSHRWNSNWTNRRPQVGAASVWQHRPPLTLDQRSTAVTLVTLNLCMACDSTESSWVEKSTGPSCCPRPVSRPSCSSSSCRGSPRVLATSSLTERMRTAVKKVTEERSDSLQHVPASNPRQSHPLL